MGMAQPLARGSETHLTHRRLDSLQEYLRIETQLYRQENMVLCKLQESLLSETSQNRTREALQLSLVSQIRYGPFANNKRLI